MYNNLTCEHITRVTRDSDFREIVPTFAANSRVPIGYCDSRFFKVDTSFFTLCNNFVLINTNMEIT